MSIAKHFPDPEHLLALEPEELAGLLLQYLNALPPGEKNALNRYNFSLRHTVQDYPAEYQDRMSRALMEAWMWLEREGFLAPKPGSQGEWVFITRRGEKAATAEGVRSYQKANLLPQKLLHPRVSQRVWATFLRGDYDTAVFQAFKEVEVAVRTAANLPDAEIGTALMRRAFPAWEWRPCGPSQAGGRARGFGAFVRRGDRFLAFV